MTTFERKRVAVDIDGVLTIETEGHDYAARTPNVPAIKLVNLLAELCDVYLFTARYPEDESVTREWLRTHGCIVQEIVFGKPKYDRLVDDRAW